MTTTNLTAIEELVLEVLYEHRGRVVTRAMLARSAGLRGVGSRRVDVALVAIRRLVGNERLVNVRSRGWMLIDESATGPSV